MVDDDMIGLLVIAKDISRKISRKWGNRNTMTKNSTNKPFSICPWRVRNALGSEHAPGAHIKGTPYHSLSRSLRKNEYFLEKMPFPEKCLPY